MTCHWSLSSNTNLELIFFRFDTESRYDFVYVYDGGSSSSPLIGQYDGTWLPSTITSSSNQLFVTFTSDGSNVGSGFAASYHGERLLSLSESMSALPAAIMTTIIRRTLAHKHTLPIDQHKQLLNLAKQHIIDYNGKKAAHKFCVVQVLLLVHYM